MTKALELTSQITDQICQSLDERKATDKDLQNKDLPSLATVHRWIDKHPDFAKQILQARRVGCTILFR